MREAAALTDSREIHYSGETRSRLVFSEGNESHYLKLK